MHKPIKYVEKGLTIAARGAWTVFDTFNQIKPNPGFTPNWSDKPLLKSKEKVKPPLGWPRETDSLCPTCVREARQSILDGKQDVSILLNEKVGEIKATILERDGKILMVKDCPIHGHFEDVMAMDTAFFKHLEDTYPGSDIRAHNDEKLHNHGTSTIKYGRGSVLTIDLTNRCNMMCDPCFMDANQVGFVHELSWEDIKTLLDNAITIKPRRQMSVQFSGGEPTLSPYFLDAVRYAKKVGYNSVQAATNGIEFAKSPEFAKAAAEAGLRYAYLQFDGIGNAANSHRLVGNLFDVKLRAIENLWSNGVDIVPVTTIVNGVNNEQVGRIIKFALDNPRKISFLSFQPVSFTGRDEEVTDERREAQRYTLSHLAHDVKNQTGLGEPVRDWFPISFMGTFTDWADLVQGPGQRVGQPLVRLPPELRRRHGRDDRQGNEGGRSGHRVPPGRAAGQGHRQGQRRGPRPLPLGDGHGARADEELRPVQVADALQAHRPDAEVRQDLRRHRQELRQGRQDAHDAGHRSAAARIAGTSCSSPGCGSRTCSTTTSAAPSAASSRMRRSRARSASAPTTRASAGVNIIEKMHMTATLTKWYEEHGRHEIYAGGKTVELTPAPHNLVLDAEAVAKGKQTDLDDKGIAKNAREEKLRARDEMKKKAEDDRMARLYRQHVLKEAKPQEVSGLQIQGLKKPAAPSDDKTEPVTTH